MQFYLAMQFGWELGPIAVMLQCLPLFKCLLEHQNLTSHSSVLAWRIPEMAEPGGLPSMGSRRVGYNWSDLAAAAAAPKYRNTRREYKNNCVQLQSGQISDKRYKKTKKSQLPFLKSQEQKQGFKSKNSVHASCTQDSKGVGKTPKPPLRADPWTNPYFYHRRNKLTYPSGLSQQGKLLLVFAVCCCTRVPSKALIEFLVQQLISVSRLRRPRSPIGNRLVNVFFCLFSLDELIHNLCIIKFYFWLRGIWKSGSCFQ